MARKRKLAPKSDEAQKQKQLKKEEEEKPQNEVAPENPESEEDDEEAEIEVEEEEETVKQEANDDDGGEPIQKLLESFSKEQLINILAEAAEKHASIAARVRRIADEDPVHRKIFVHGLR